MVPQQPSPSGFLLVVKPGNGRPAAGPAPGADRVADPAAAAEVAAGLLAYFRRRFRAGHLRYLLWPTPVPEGWETYTYRFQFLNASTLPPAFARPLILRVFAGTPGVPRARHEFAVQRSLEQTGYRVASPLLLEERCDVFGGPFQIMEQVPGETLFRGLLRRPWWIWPAARRMAATHADLHALPPTGFPAPTGPFLPRRLQELREIIQDYGLEGLKPGLDWLATHRPSEPETAHILHLDFHPVNLVGGLEGPAVVLDWTEADVGDLHADVATTLMLLACSPIQGRTRRERLALRVGSVFLRRWYLRAYRKRMPVDEPRLNYYRAWAALRRLCGYGRWLQAGPQSTGCKPCSLRYLTPEHLATVHRYFHRWTGVEVCLGVV
jgi:aminoglycoside phosphotransferase (APT) family kinase protein